MQQHKSRRETITRTRKQTEITKLVRLMSIHSIVQNGFKSKLYDSIKKDFLNVKINLSF